MDHRRSKYITDTESSQLEDCLICQKGIQNRDFPLIIHKALERKYCSGLNNHHSTKIIRQILSNEV